MKITDQIDEQVLQHYIQSNEMQYYLNLFSRYQDMILGVCYLYLNDIQQTEHIVLKIKNKLVKDIKSAPITKFPIWLYNYVRKECLTHLEEQHIPVPETLTEPIPLEPIDPFFNPSLPNSSLENLISCLESLPDNQQLVIKLFYIKEMTFEEIEKATGFEVFKIKNYITKGRKNLKTCMLQNPLTH